MTKSERDLIRLITMSHEEFLIETGLREKQYQALLGIVVELEATDGSLMEQEGNHRCALAFEAIGEPPLSGRWSPYVCLGLVTGRYYHARYNGQLVH